MSTVPIAPPPKGGDKPKASAPDERLRKVGIGKALLRRPELGAVGGLLAVTAFFLVTANPVMFTVAGIVNFLQPASQLGILAIGAALLMIGGEFDLSLGSMVAFAGLVFAACLVTLHLTFASAVALTFVAAVTVGVINAQITIRTGLPSFIVTLAFLFNLQGLTLVGLKWATGGATQLRGVREAIQPGVFADLFSGLTFENLFQWLAANDLIGRFPNGQPTISGLPVSILWFVALALAATLLLLRTRFGNWIFAAGGDPNAARNSGVPVVRVKTLLFVMTACCAALVAILTVVESGSTDARRGFQKEFEAIIAAVIGGCLLTGGYGSAIGAFFGSIIFGMVLIGLTYTGIDQDWYQVFLGTMLLIAVAFNNMIRKRATGER